MAIDENKRDEAANVLLDEISRRAPSASSTLALALLPDAYAMVVYGERSGLAQARMTPDRPASPRH